MTYRVYVRCSDKWAPTPDGLTYDDALALAAFWRALHYLVLVAMVRC